MRRTKYRGWQPWRALAAAGIFLACASVLWAQSSGTGAARSAAALFERGLTALHHFEYEEALDNFQQAQAADPRLTLAYWGEAMTYEQPLWRRENVDAARQALAKLAPTRAARAARATDERSRGLLHAADALFGGGSPRERHDAYLAAMKELHERLPADPDVASLYALTLIAGASRGLIGAADLHLPGLAGSDIQARAAAILQHVLATHPRHPGALHYLLHTYDDPQHARLALEAARTYASVAGGASHALHMPAHIFLQLGLWHDAAASDRAAYDASKDWVARKKLPETLRNFHALSWLEYELLQLGRFGEAKAAIDDIAPVASAQSGAGAHGGHQPLLSDWSSMRARYVIESERWDFLAGEQNFGNVDELFALGLSAAYRRETAKAERVRQLLGERSVAVEEGDLRPAIAIMERELAALIARASGRGDEAIAILQEAARTEAALPAPFGLPSPPKPAPELLGEILLDAKRPREARAAFDQAMARNANRSLSIRGLARAASALGDVAASNQRYRELLANYNGADAGIPAVGEARSALGGRKTGGDTGQRLEIAAVVGAGTLAMVGIFMVRRGSGRRRAAAAAEKKAATRTSKRKKAR